jgi:hypothetical protein
MPFLRRSGGAKIVSRVAAAQIVDFAPAPIGPTPIPQPARTYNGQQRQQECYANRSRNYVRELHGITSHLSASAIGVAPVKQSYLTAS